MHKKYPVVIHAVLLLFCLLFLFGMFVERTDTGGVIDSRRVQPTCQEINYTEMVEENDPDAPVGVTRIFHFQLNSDLAGKQLMFYVINANTRVYHPGKACVRLEQKYVQSGERHRLLLGESAADPCRQRQGSRR